uniref:CASP8-associated protein 2 n=1 Tax=Cacopsylla melanoneura TaxID=428564 RepID=A0A8D8M5D1_9HEMI
MSQDEEDDLYNDLFARTEELVDPDIIQNLKQEIEHLQLEKDNLHKKVTELENTNLVIQTENQTLKTNISSLFKTAKNELERKTKLIDQMRVDSVFGRPRYSSQPDSSRHNSPATSTNSERNTPSGCKDSERINQSSCKDSEQKQPDYTTSYHSSSSKTSTSQNKHIESQKHDRQRHRYDNDRYNDDRYDSDRYLSRHSRYSDRHSDNDERYHSKHSRYTDRHSDSRTYSEFRDDRKQSLDRIRESELRLQEFETGHRRSSESNQSSNIKQGRNSKHSEVSPNGREVQSKTEKSKTPNNDCPNNEKVSSQDCDSDNSKTDSTTKSDSPTKRSQSPSSSKNSNIRNNKNCSLTNTKSENSTNTKTSNSINVTSNSPSSAKTENTTNKPSSLTNAGSDNPSNASEPERQTTSLCEKPSWMLQSQPKPSPKPPPPAQKVVVHGPPNLYNRRLEVRVNKESKKLHQEALDKYLIAVNPPSEKTPSSKETMPGKFQLETKGIPNSVKTTAGSNNSNGPKVSPKPTSLQVNSVPNTSSNTSILGQLLQGKQVSPDLSKSSPKVSSNNKSNFKTSHVISVLETAPTTVKQSSPPNDNKAPYKSLSDKIKEIKQNVHTSPVLVEKKENSKQVKIKDAALKSPSEVSPKELTQGKAKCHRANRTPESTTCKVTFYPQSIFEPEVQLHCESSCESNFSDTRVSSAIPEHGASTSTLKHGGATTLKSSIKQTPKPEVKSKPSCVQRKSSRLSRNLSNQFPSNNKCALSSVDFIPVYNLETSEKQPSRTESKNKSRSTLKLGDISIKLTSPGKKLTKSAEHSTICTPTKVETMTKVLTLTDPKSSIALSPLKNQSLEVSPNQNNQNEANCPSPQPSVSTAVYDEDSQDVTSSRRKRKFVIVDSEDENSLPASKKLIIEGDKKGKETTVISEQDKHGKEDTLVKQTRKEKRKRLKYETFNNESNAASNVENDTGGSHVKSLETQESLVNDLQVQINVSPVPEELNTAVKLTPALENSTSPLKTNETPEIFHQETIDTPDAPLDTTSDSVLNTKDNVEVATDTSATNKQNTMTADATNVTTTVVSENKAVAAATNAIEAPVVPDLKQPYQLPTCTTKSSDMSQITSDQMNSSDIVNSTRSDPNTSRILNTRGNSSVNDVSQKTNESEFTKKTNDTLRTTEDANVSSQNDSFSQQNEVSLNCSTQSSLNNSSQSCSFSARRENRFSLLSKRRPARVSRVVVKKIIITSPQKKEVIVINAHDNGKDSATDVTSDLKICDGKINKENTNQENENHGEELKTSTDQNQAVEKPNKCDEIVVETPENTTLLSASENTTCNEPVKCTQATEDGLKETNSLAQYEHIDMDTISHVVKTLSNAFVEQLKQVSNAQIDTNVESKTCHSTLVDNELNAAESDCNVSTSTPCAQRTSASCLEKNSSPTSNTIETSSAANMKSTQLQTVTDSDPKVKPTRERRMSQRRSSTNDISNPKQSPLQVEKPALEGDESTLDANDIVGRVLRDGTKPVLNLNISNTTDVKAGDPCEGGDREDKENMISQVENRSCTPNKTKEEYANEKMSEEKQNPITPVRQSSQNEPSCKPITPVRQPTITEPVCSFQDMDINSDSKWKATNAELKNETFNYSGKKPKKRISHYVKPSDGTPSPGSKATDSPKRTPDKKVFKVKLSPLKKELAQAIYTSYKVASFRDCISTQPVPKSEKINVLTPRKSPKGGASTSQTSESLSTIVADTTKPAANNGPNQVTNIPQTVETAKPNKTLVGSKKQSFLQRDIQMKLKAMNTLGTRAALSSVNPMLKPNCVPTTETINIPSLTTGIFRPVQKPNTSAGVGRVEDKKHPNNTSASSSPRFLIPEALEENARFVSITSKTSTITSTSTTSCTLEQSSRTSTKRFTSFESNSSSSLSLFTSTLSDAQFRNEHTISPFRDAERLMNETPFKQFMTGTFSCVSPMAQTPYKTADHSSDVTQDTNTHYEDRIFPDLRTPIKPIITSSCDSETARLQNLADELALTPDGNSGTSVESGASDPPANDIRCHVESMASFQRDTMRPSSSINNGILAISSCQSVYKLSGTVLKPDELMVHMNKNKTSDQQTGAAKTNTDNQTTMCTVDDANKQREEGKRRSSTSEKISSEVKIRRNSEKIQQDPKVSEPKTTSNTSTEEKQQSSLEHAVIQTNHQEHNVNHNPDLKNTKDDTRTQHREVKERRRKSISQSENTASKAKKVHIVSDAEQNTSRDRENNIDRANEPNKARNREQHRDRNKGLHDKQHNSSCDSQRLDSSINTDLSQKDPNDRHPNDRNPSNRDPNNRYPNDRNPNYGDPNNRDLAQRDVNKREPINRRKRRRSSSSPSYRDKSRDRSRHYSDRKVREQQPERIETQPSPERKIRERSKTPPNKLRKQSRSPNRRQRDKSSPERKTGGSSLSKSPNKSPRDQSPERKMSDSTQNRRERDAGVIRKHRDNTQPDERYRDRREHDKSRRRDYFDRPTRYGNGSRGRTRKYSGNSSERKYRESSRERDRRKNYREHSCERPTSSRQKIETIETPVKKVIVKEILYYTESSIRGRSTHSEDEREREPRQREKQRVMDKEDGRGEKRAMDRTRRDEMNGTTSSRSRRSGNDFQDSETHSKHNQSRDCKDGSGEHNQECTTSRPRRSENEFHDRNKTNGHRQEHSREECRGSCSKQEPTSTRQDSSSNSPEQFNSKKHGSSCKHTRTISSTNRNNDNRVETMCRGRHNDSTTSTRPNDTRHNAATELNDSIERSKKTEYPNENKPPSDNRRSTDIRSRTGRGDYNSSANDSNNLIDSSNQLDSSHEELEPNLNHTESTRTPKGDNNVSIESEEDEGLCSSSSNDSFDRFTK